MTRDLCDRSPGGFLHGEPKPPRIRRLKPGTVVKRSKAETQLIEKVIRQLYFVANAEVADLAKLYKMTAEQVTEVIAATPESVLKKFGPPIRKPPKLTFSAKCSIVGESRLRKKTPEEIAKATGFDVATIREVLAEHERLKQLSRSPKPI